ncbi:MAG: hypothetical protein RJA70_4377 [Pseudomonadota bacterium]|jgi:2-dehydropantoate 2-reductase
MRIAVIGAGALGRAFAAALRRAGADVTLVTRQGHEQSAQFTVCHRGLWDQLRAVTLPVSSTLPVAELYLLAIRGEQLEETQVEPLLAALRETQMPVLLLSPVLPAGAARMRERLPEVILSMPAVACHWHPEHQRLDFWSSRFAPTEIEPSTRTPGASRTFVRLLRRGGIAARVTPDVARAGVATTVAFFPLQVAVVAGGRLLSWPRTPELLQQIGLALREASTLARQLGPIALGIRVLVGLASFPSLLRLGCRVVPYLQPSLVRFLEHHFGPKLLAQHRLFTAQIAQLGLEHGCPTPHLSRLMALANERCGSSKAQH